MRPTSIEWIPKGTRVWVSDCGRWRISNTGGFRLFRDEVHVLTVPTFTEATDRAAKLSQDMNDRRPIR